MADSIEQKIIDEIVARMQLILTSGGYQTNIGATVEDSRPHWSQDELPATSVFQGTTTTEKTDDEEVEVVRKFPVMIRTSFERRDDAAADAAYARQIISDVKRAIRIDREWRTDIADPRTALAYMTTEVTHGIEFVPDTFEISGTQTEIAVTYYGTNFDMEA